MIWEIMAHSLTTCDAVKSIKPGSITKSLEREGKEKVNLIQPSFGSSGINGTQNFRLLF